MSKREHVPSSHLAISHMKEGFQKRKFFEWGMPSMGDQGTSEFTHTSSVLGFPAPRTRGIMGLAIRTCRRIVKRLMAPWIELQTRFNHICINRILALESQVADTREKLITCYAEVIKSQVCEEALRRSEAPKFSEMVEAIEAMYLHTRLSPPPGQALVIAPNGRHALELAALGFQTVLLGPSLSESRNLRHPDLTVLPGTDDKIPYAAGHFDLVVLLGGSCRNSELAHTGAHVPPFQDIVRVLSPTGRVIGSTWIEPNGDQQELPPLTLVNVVYARRVGHGWTLSCDREPSSEIQLWVAQAS